MLGDRGHGADVLRLDQGDAERGAGKGGGKQATSWTPQHGKGGAALPALGLGTVAGMQGTPLWQTMG